MSADIGTNLLTSIDLAFANLPKVRDASHERMLGAARAIEQFVYQREPERPIPATLIAEIFKLLSPQTVAKDAPFPRYFTAQEGRFGQGCMFLRCDDKERSVRVMEDGSEVAAGPGCRYGACVNMAVNGSWQEITEQDAKELIG